MLHRIHYYGIIIQPVVIDIDKTQYTAVSGLIAITQIRILNHDQKIRQVLCQPVRKTFRQFLGSALGGNDLHTSLCIQYTCIQTL